MALKPVHKQASETLRSKLWWSEAVCGTLKRYKQIKQLETNKTDKNRYQPDKTDKTR